ncbi:hypothetical protein F5Y08DRAFT_354694 [Xylaria arbuscula]|nr:hypothetical protein F5Y08DRAFT_354694 [Xylaria arbuscula]
MSNGIIFESDDNGSEVFDLSTLRQKISDPKMNAPSEPLTSFHKFPDLPVELQLMIWKLCLPQRPFELTGSYPDHSFYDRPLISQACRLSRDQARLYAGWKPAECNLPEVYRSTCHFKLPEPSARFSISTVVLNIFWRDASEIDPSMLQFLANPKTPICIDPMRFRQGWYWKKWFPIEMNENSSENVESVEDTENVEDEDEDDEDEEESEESEESEDEGDEGWYALSEEGNSLHEQRLQRIFKHIILKHKECTVIVDSITLHYSDAEEASRCGLFGLFGDQTSTHISLTDFRSMKKLFSEMHSQVPQCDRNSRNDEIQQYMSDLLMRSFFQHIRALVLKVENLYPRSHCPSRLPPLEKMDAEWRLALEKLPTFHPVIRVSWAKRRDQGICWRPSSVPWVFSTLHHLFS